MVPTTILPPPTKLPNVRTTLPGSPVRRIKRVDETFNEMRKIVVNSNNVGKNDISSTSFTNNTLNRIIKAIAILKASITSNNNDGIGTIKKTTAQSKYNPTPISAFFNICNYLLSAFYPSGFFSRYT